MEKKIAVVTGGNKGIGFAICRALAKNNFHVVLTARSAEKGQAACEQLKKEGLDVSFFPLEVTEESQIQKLKSHLEKEFSRCDVLVNNAGIFLDRKGPNVLEIGRDVIEETLRTNTLAPLRISQVLLPMMKKRRSGRIVNLSSGLGQLDEMQTDYMAYRVSKTALNAVTKILAYELKGTNILVNAMCPGWVKTDMGGPNAQLTPEQGADTALWLATLPDNGPAGGFFRERKSIPW